ncbi:uncharacterized protein [Salminus brasiliensis]|uniref:uncharacterized protein n=1 Tax=Salminus brasiliensis TaxID=930266 RepID=UPI003B82EFA9
MEEHPVFSNGEGEPNCLSMKSDLFIPEPPEISCEGEEPSFAFMKSGRPMVNPPGFSSEAKEPSCVSMKADQTMEIFPGFNSEAVSSDERQCSTEMNTLLEGNKDQLQDFYQPEDDVLYRILERHKASMKNKCEGFFEHIKTQTLLNMIHTQLYITEGRDEDVNEEHEILQMGKTLSKYVQSTQMDCIDIFRQEQDPKAETEEDVKEQRKRRLKIKENMRAVFRLKERHKDRKEDKKPKLPKLRTVLTKGIAGIGKTVSVQKFILDWAEEKANQDVELMFVLPFRELNLIKDDQYSLHQLMCVFHPELKDLDPKIYDVFKSVFIFDGLDESRIPLNFSQCEKVSDITMTSSVDVIMTNLIKGDLLPSALIWITSRPAAANQIPSQYINSLTEIKGFSDPQKEEYFRKRISDQDQAQKIISHIKTARSLHIMSHIPIFCWISATVLQRIMDQDSDTEIPKTLTEMYLHFLITQTSMKKEKHEEKEERDPQKLLESNRTQLLKLAELAFKQLMKGKAMFYEEDLRESSIDVTEASVYSGIFWKIFREDCVLYQRKVYCFVHLSVQEFLAAAYVFHCYENKNMTSLQLFLDEYDSLDSKNSEKDEHSDESVNIPLDELLKRAVQKAVESQNGHLDLFLSFLLGISLDSNQRLLQGLLTPTHSSSEETIKYIKKQIKEDANHSLSAEKSISLFFCLSEMNDQSLFRELQEYLKSENISEEKLSPGQCSALAYTLLISGEVLDELDLKKYNTSEEGYRRLMPAVTVCRKAILGICYLTNDSWKTLCSVLQSANSSLKELDLGNNDLQDSEVELLFAELKSSHCKLETLRLALCKLGEKACEHLGSLLQSVNSPLKELDLSNNDIQDAGVELLCAGLRGSCCKLETLRLALCNLGGKACKSLGSALQSGCSSLKKLDLSNNDLKDSGVELLSAGLKSSCCKLETLRLDFCNLGDKACDILTSALQSVNCNLKELDLSNNDLQDSGVELLSAGLKSPHFKLETLRLSGCMVTYEGCSALASALKSNSSYLRELDLTYNHPGESGVRLLSDLLEDPHCKLEKLQVEHGGRIRIKPGLKKYGCKLTLDPNTAHTRLSLSDENRKVQRVEEQIFYLDHSKRFKHWEQVLSVESLTGRCYWEAEWSESGVYVAVSYRGISREEDSGVSGFGLNNQSWSLYCSDKRFTFRHDEKETVVLPSRSRSRCRRVGVYLDWPAGALSFYSISPNTHTVTHLHTFYAMFTEPLHAGFRVDYGSSVWMCDTE